MSFVLPMGFDFADGVTTLPVSPSGAVGTPTIVGTPLPTASLFIYGNFGSVIDPQEPPGSPRIERAEQATCEHSLEMSWVDALAYLVQMGRGTIVSDSDANIWRILSCDATREEGTKGRLHYVMESISFDSPPDDFRLVKVALDLNIVKHPRYAWALNPYVSDNSTFTLVGDTQIFYTDIKQAIIRAIQSYTDSPFYPNEDQVNSLIQNNIMSQLNPSTGGSNTGKISVNYPNKAWNPANVTVSPVPWDGTNLHLPTVNAQYFVVGVPYDLTNTSDPIVIATAAARELISKLWRQEDTPLLIGYDVEWVQRFFTPIYLNPGCYLEDFRDWVPEYFTNPNFTSNTVPRGDQSSVGPVGPPSSGNSDTIPAGGTGADSILDFLTTINPQCYATNGVRGGPLAISCLRDADDYNYERTWFAVSHTWHVAPIGKFDSDIYNQNNRPQISTDYNQLPSSFGG